jgi:GT2 family glycosyltransferase
MSVEATIEGLSVVVPVKDRVEELARLLESLEKAIPYCPEPVEVIVVDDSGPFAAAAHQAACREHSARYLRGPRNVGAKRNVGVEAAVHDLVLFTDSDCRVTPDLLGRHVATLRAAAPDVAGTTGPTRVEAGDGRVFRIMQRSELLNGSLERPARYRTVGWATTSNLAVRREAFRSVGGFHPEPLTVVAGEDVDLGLRLVHAGRRIVCDPEAAVIHDRGSTDSLARVCQRLFHYGRSGQWLSTVHPGQRGFKLNVVTALGAATVAGLLGARASGRRSLLLLPPVVAGALLGRDLFARRRNGFTAADLACVAVEWCFDLGEFVAALQLRRPDLLASGFGWLDDEAFVACDEQDQRSYG